MPQCPIVLQHGVAALGGSTDPGDDLADGFVIRVQMIAFGWGFNPRPCSLVAFVAKHPKLGGPDVIKNMRSGSHDVMGCPWLDWGDV